MDIIEYLSLLFAHNSLGFREKSVLILKVNIVNKIYKYI